MPTTPDECVCPTPFIGEHMRSCPFHEPPLTEAEIRVLRQILSFLTADIGKAAYADDT